MKSRRTHLSTNVIGLPGGNEDNDLWVFFDEHSKDGSPMIRSTWVPTDEERRRIAEGENVELIVWGLGHPPVAMEVVNYPLGAPPADGG